MASHGMQEDQDMEGQSARWDGILYENDKCTIELIDDEKGGESNGMQVDNEL